MFHGKLPGEALYVNTNSLKGGGWAEMLEQPLPKHKNIPLRV